MTFRYGGVHLNPVNLKSGLVRNSKVEAMKRSGWIACLMFGGLAGLAAAAWSRPSIETEDAKPVGSNEQAEECSSTGGEACSCGTGTSRAALLKQPVQPKQ